MNLPYIKQAFFSKRYRNLEYFDSRNTTIIVQCDSLKKARKIIELSKIDQELIIRQK